jgi:myo-inositol 2-dehydrogenase/D-chiro-inositol 1-dehydrogenase
MEDLKAAIIGCGGRARGHAEAYVKVPGVRLAAVTDVDRERADGFATTYESTAYYDAAAMLEQVRPDIVSVVTRAKERCEVVELCAEHGVKAINAEKPMAITLEEADRMVAACERAGTTLTISHQMRYCPEFERGKEAIEGGEIGQVYFLRGVCYGNLMNQGTHVIDMLRWFMGDARVSWVLAQADEYDWPERDRGHPAPMWTLGYLAFENGVRATLESGPRYTPAIGTSPGWLNKRVEVLGTDGMVDSVVGNYCRVLTGKTPGWQGLEIGVEGWNNATIRFTEDLVRVVREGGEHRNGAKTSHHTFEVIQALAESARRGGIVELPLPREGRDPLGELLAGR